MIRILAKTALIAFILGGFSLPGWAAEISGKINGRARATLVQEIVKDGASTLDMDADGRFGYEMSTKDGGWTGTGYVQLGLSSDGSISLRDTYVGLENATLAITAGRQFPWGVTVGNKYLTDNIGDIYWAGENATKNGRDSFVKVGLKPVGLSFVLGMNPQTDAADGVTTAVDDVYSETVAAAIFSTSVSSLSINASYISVSSTIDEKQTGAAAKKSALDGYTQSSIALGVGFDITKMIGIALNVDQVTVQKGGSPAPDPVADQYVTLIFDLGLSDSMGVTAAYNTYTQDDGSDKPLAKTAIVAGFNATVAGTGLYVQYYSETAKDDDVPTDTATTKVGAGMTYNF